MKTIDLKWVFALLTISLNIGVTWSQDATAILKRMDEVMFSPKDMTGNMRVVMTDRNGRQDIREATLKQKGTDSRLFRFTSPASQAGISVLSLPDDVMYLYLPAFGRERRIAGSAKNQNFAGTDFSYDDMESKPYSEKYDPKLLKSEENSFVLELTPREASDYSVIVANIHQTEYYPESMVYYDRGNNKLKTAKYTYRKSGNYWYASEIEMTNHRSGRVTQMQMSEVRYDTGLRDEDFSVRVLRQ